MTTEAKLKHHLLLCLVMLAVMVGGLLVVAVPSAQAQVQDASCTEDGIFCLRKEVNPEAATVGEPVTFTVTAFCDVEDDEECAAVDDENGLTDTLPLGVRFVSATASGPVEAECEESGGTVTCAPLLYGEIEGEDFPYVVEIVVVPERCGTFTNTAADHLNEVSVDFTVVGCEDEEAPVDQDAIDVDQEVTGGAGGTQDQTQDNVQHFTATGATFDAGQSTDSSSEVS